MFENFGVDIVNIFKLAEKERLNLKHPYVGTEHLLLAIMSLDKNMSSFLKKYELSYHNFLNELKKVVGVSHKTLEINLYTPLLKRVINGALEDAKENNDGIVTTKHLLLSLLEEGEGIAIRLLIGMEIDVDAIYEELNKSNKLVNKKLDLFEIGDCLNESINFDEKVIGRDKEINSIIETLLRKKKNNPILLGDAGVGKTAIVEELVRRIVNKDVPEVLFDTKIVSLEMGSLVSGTKYRGEFEEKLTKIIKELEDNSNVILFIDEIHSMVNAGGAEGAITAGDIFKPALARGKIKCIGATTRDEYLKYFSNDKALMRRFEVVNVGEPNKEQTKNILLKVKGEYELHHNVTISEDIIDKIIDYTDKFIFNKKNPDKAIDFLDSLCSKVKNSYFDNNCIKTYYNELSLLEKKKKESIKKNKYDKALEIYNKEESIRNKIKKLKSCHNYVAEEKDIIDVLESKTNKIFNMDNLSFLDSIELEINKTLFNVSNYSSKIIKLIHDNVVNKNGVLKILLEGPAYLGKTTISKIIGNNYPNCNFIKIDLKEYKSSSDINKLLGATQGYVGYNDNHTFSKVKNGLFCIVLFDNYNEAHPSIKELIKEILKDGYITDNKNEIINFNNTYIFITNDIEKSCKVGFENKDSNNYNELYSIVDSTISFNKLTKDTLEKYLQEKEVIDIEGIISKSNYEKYNYKNISKLIDEKNLIKN